MRLRFKVFPGLEQPHPFLSGGPFPVHAHGHQEICSTSSGPPIVGAFSRSDTGYTAHPSLDQDSSKLRTPYTIDVWIQPRPQPVPVEDHGHSVVDLRHQCVRLLVKSEQIRRSSAAFRPNLHIIQPPCETTWSRSPRGYSASRQCSKVRVSSSTSSRRPDSTAYLPSTGIFEKPSGSWPESATSWRNTTGELQR